MIDSRLVSSISTHYYKIAHILSVTYSIYAAKESAGDQVLLELELQIRYQHPRILLTYYNKSLYCFQFGHWSHSDHSEENGIQSDASNDDPANPANLKLHLLYPQLALKYENTVSAELLANPSRVLRNAANKKDPNVKEDSPDDHLAFVSLSFLKAVKKTLVYNLSALGQMSLFGNYVLGGVSGTSSQYGIVQVDPILLANGDLIVSLSLRNRLALFKSAILNLDHAFLEFASSFVVYVIPSGLRCHLYDLSSMHNNFTQTPPKSSENLLRLLKLSTGVDLSQRQPILWVKLIPNLQHLNNQTSKVSRFVHDVDNKKYILWPWDLCMLQFGSVEQPDTPEAFVPTVDPLSLISDFIQFSISSHEDYSQTKHDPEHEGLIPNPSSMPDSAPYPFSVPSALSAGLSTGDNEKAEDTNIDIPVLNHEVLDIFGLQQSDNFGVFGTSSVIPDVTVEGASDEIEIVPKAELPPEEENYVDDLFGESSELDSEENVATKGNDPDVHLFESETVSDGNSTLQTNGKISNESDKDSAPTLTEKDDSFSALSLDFRKDGADSIYVGIPRDQMISQAPKISSPMSYDDPGAPPPIMPTPVIAQTLQNAPFSSTYGYSEPSSQMSRSFQPQSRVPPRSMGPFSQRESQDVENPLSYAFSPIAFNPIIKSNIDTKYGRGGKFYVARESSFGPDSEPRKLRLRETSVSAYDIPSADGQKVIGANTEVGGIDQGIDGLDPTSMFRKGDEPLHDSALNEQHEQGNVEHMDDHNNYENDVDVDDEGDDDDEESDVDEELYITELKTSPLKLNTFAGDIFHMGVPNNAAYESQKQNGILFNPSFFGNQTSAYLSPGSAPQPRSVGATRVESPFGFNIGTVELPHNSFSPAMNADTKQRPRGFAPPTHEELNMQVDLPIDKESRTTDTVNTPASAGSSSNGISESSNCLPLILRSINVFCIPNLFLLNNIPGAWGSMPITSGFNMDVDEEEDDIEIKDGGLTVRAKDLNEFLKWLTPNLVFDLGLLKFEKRIRLNLPDLYPEEVVSEITDGGVSLDIETQFSNAFPLSYRIHLSEFISEFGTEEGRLNDSQPELKDQLSFLDDITEGGLMDSDSPAGKLGKFQWDSIFSSSTNNRDSFNAYKNIVNDLNESLEQKVEDSAVFMLNDVKTKVLKNNDNIVNLNYVGVRFWKYLNFRPVNGPKRFQVLLISENDLHISNGNLYDEINLGFLDLLKNSYKENHLGSIKKLNLQTSDTRPDLEGISNGIMLVDRDAGESTHRDYYKRVNKKLKNLAELIKLDLINKTNRFEFGRPLLLLFVNYDQSINSVLQISKICRNFKLFLNDHQLSLVDVFAHIVPWNHIIKLSDHRRRLRYLSNSKLSKLSMNLYNKCPQSEQGDTRLGSHHKDETKKLYTQLVKEPPTSLHFKFLNKINKEGSSSVFHDDIFLHVAYERSVDKNWLSAAWSDPLGVVTCVKSWFCSSAPKNGTHNADVHDLGSIINEIWDVSNTLFKKLNEDVIQRTCGSGNKKFLVLTRINSIIPDDELVFWKRLTTKYKEVSLIVLSTNRTPKFLFTSPANGTQKKDYDDPQNVSPNVPFYPVRTSMSGQDFIKSFSGFPGANGNSPSGGMNVTSPMNAGSVGFHSPHQFINTLANFLSPLDGVGTTSAQTDIARSIDVDDVVRDPNLDVIGVIPKTPLPSFNLPTRLGMRIGYLIREAPQISEHELRYMVFEVTLLSCSAYWSLNAIMKILLSQYKKLIVLNDILGTTENNVHAAGEANTSDLHALVPWHINAVVKALDYLVHVYVEE